MKALRILVFEDDAPIGMLLSATLADLGHEVCGIESTEAGALAAATRCQPDLIIADAGLNGGSGVAAVKRICAARPVPHVFMSGKAIEPQREGAQVLMKPFLKNQLVRAIQQALELGIQPRI